MTNQQEHIAQLENTILELQAENKRLRKIIAKTDDNIKWVKPKPKFWGNKNG
jgi:septal ring factor EnvC (AmiA/AmiB activator)